MKSGQKAALFMSASILLSSVAQLCMKAGMLLIATQSGGLPAILQHPASLLWVGAGLACYGVSLLCWMSAIAWLDLSLAYPMLSLSYVLVYVVATHWPLLHEEASWMRTFGILVVVAGVVLIARSKNPTIAPVSTPPK